jgi:phage/plasmid-associated DNA primase
LNIISDHNNELNDHIINWISYLLQNPGSKTETAFFIIGEQGTGKHQFFTDIISKLFGRYQIANEKILILSLVVLIVHLRIRY